MKQFNLLDWCPVPNSLRYREELRSPWSRRGWTYATDGVTIVRVPLDPEYPDRLDAPKMTNLWDDHYYPQGDYSPIELPSYRECVANDEDEEDIIYRPIILGNRLFDYERFRKILELPNVTFASTPADPESPLAFRFFGGCAGITMPMRLNGKTFEQIGAVRAKRLESEVAA